MSSINSPPGQLGVAMTAQPVQAKIFMECRSDQLFFAISLGANQFPRRLLKHTSDILDRIGSVIKNLQTGFQIKSHETRLRR